MRYGGALVLIALILTQCGEPGPPRPGESAKDLAKRYGYKDPQAMIVDVETELARRSFKRQLQLAGKPHNVRLSRRFRRQTDAVLIALKNHLNVYGPDDREEALQQSRPTELDRNVRSTCAVFHDSVIVRATSGSGWELHPDTPTLEETGVCKGEKFHTQKVAALCTAFIIDKDVVATAGHCVRNAFELKTRKFVFDYVLAADGTQPTTFTDQQVFTGKKILGRVEVPFGEDWAVVQLDRNIGRTALPLRQSGDVSDRDPLYVIGHPSGLPSKYAPNAEVLRNEQTSPFFVANLDVFGGNSGSPVFSASTHRVEGILVRGEVDYVSVGDCSKPKECPAGGDGCKGEHVTRIKLVKYST